jgi:4-oxalomesaconate tautomerase
MNDQVKIPCMFIRGGTSRGPYFLKSDLPSDINKRDKILLAAMGSPDLRQIDGLGGAEPVKSKVAIIDKSSEEGIDIDYYFAQVKIDKPIVDTKPSCGNILVGVGPYAIEKGLVEAKNGETSVIVRDKNTGMKIEQIVQTPNKQVQYDGNFKIDGVPTPGSPIKLKFLDFIYINLFFIVDPGLLSR